VIYINNKTGSGYVYPTLVKLMNEAKDSGKVNDFILSYVSRIVSWYDENNEEAKQLLKKSFKKQDDWLEKGQARKLIGGKKIEI
jgi:hypothetical protein